MPGFLVNWKTTLLGLTPLVPYVLQHFGLWPAVLPLPPLESIWPAVAASIGLGAAAKDSNVTGGTKQQ